MIVDEIGHKNPDWLCFYFYGIVNENEARLTQQYLSAKLSTDDAA